MYVEMWWLSRNVVATVVEIWYHSKDAVAKDVEMQWQRCSGLVVLRWLTVDVAF